MYLCLDLRGLAHAQFLKANDEIKLYGIKSMYVIVPASKAKETIKRDLLQSMELNNRIQ